MKKLVFLFLVFCAASCYAQNTDNTDSASFNVPGRKLKKTPHIRLTHPDTGKVAVDITVNSEGKVIQADYNKNESNTTDTFLVKLALKGALQMKYDKSDIPVQKGDIVFIFAFSWAE